MKKYNLNGYRSNIIHTCEIYHWKPMVEDENDRRIAELLFDGQLPMIEKATKKRTMMYIMYVMFGRQTLNDLLEKGLTD